MRREDLAIGKRMCVCVGVWYCKLGLVRFRYQNAQQHTTLSYALSLSIIRAKRYEEM